MEHISKENGFWVEPMEEALLPISRAKSMKAIGETIKLMVTEYTLIVTVRDMKASGTKICSMAKEQKVGLMAQNLQESISKDEKTVLGNTSGQTVPLMKVNGMIMKQRGTVIINGVTAESTWVIGKEI